MRVLFCKISYMKYYRGASSLDTPINGGSYVEENGKGYEEYNFYPRTENEGKPFLLGFVETKKGNGQCANEVHIEKIEGCEALVNADEAEDVLVIWCATDADAKAKVVGWYNHATVYRTYQNKTLSDGSDRIYNVIANQEDCVLLPQEKRNEAIWSVKVARKHGFGFGQSMLWYPTEEKAQEYVKNLTEAIKNYKGENGLDKEPEEMVKKENRIKI